MNSGILLEDNLHFLKNQSVPNIEKPNAAETNGSYLSEVGRIMTPKDARILILDTCENLKELCMHH